MIHNLGPVEVAETRPAPVTPPLTAMSDANVLAALQVERMNVLRVKHWTGAIIRLAFSLGLAGVILAVFYSVIRTYLRWAGV